MKMYFRKANFLLSESRIAADKWITRIQIELSFPDKAVSFGISVRCTPSTGVFA